MKDHQPEKISALLDGELRGLQRWLTERHLRQCVICEAEYRHLQHVRQMLADHPPRREMEGSPEFFWSQVKREIERRGDESVTLPQPRLPWFDWARLHAPAMATISACLLVAVTLFALRLDWGATDNDRANTGRMGTTVVAADPGVPDTYATPLPADDSDVTVIWLSGLPWTPSLSEMKTVLSTLDT